MADLMLNKYQKPGKEHYKILAFSWAGWIFDFYDLILFTFLLILLGNELHFSNLMLSYALGASLAATALGGVIFGALSDLYGRKTILQWTIILYSIGTFLCGLTFSLESLILFRIITGLGVGGEWATGQTYIGETFPADLRGRYGSLMQTGASFGIILASLVAGFLAPIIGWRESFMISILPAVMVIFIRRNLRESDLWLQNKKSFVKNSLEKINPQRQINKFKMLFTKYRKSFLISLILTIFGLSAFWFAYSWMPDYLYSERHFSLAKSAMWVLFTQVGGFLGTLSFGYVADWLGRRPAFSIYGILMAISLVMITLFWNVVVVYPVIILSFMFMVGFGSGFFGGYGPLFSEMFPTAIRNTATGSVYNIGRGVQFFTPIIIALLASKYNLGIGIFIAALFALLTGAWIWTFPETKGKRIE